MKIKGVLEILRVPNDIMIGIAVLIGEYVSLSSIPSINLVIFGFLSAFLLSSAVMVLNDYFDLPVDKINNPNRPLIRGDVSIDEALFLAYICMFFGILLSLFLSFYNFLIAIIFLILGVLYNWKIKKFGLLGNTIVSLSVSIPYIYGMVAVRRFIYVIWFLALMSFLSNMGREIIKGICDIEGDITRSIKTVAVKLGSKKAAVISGLFTLSAVVISFIPWILGLLNFLYIIVVQIANILFVMNTFKIMKNPSKKVAFKVKKNFLIAMMIGLISFILGSIKL